MKVRWAASARRDRADIMDHIATESPRVAVRIDELFEKTTARLSDHPYLGRTGSVAGTRELFPHENYWLVYEVEVETVRVLAIVHASRQWPPVTD